MELRTRHLVLKPIAVSDIPDLDRMHQDQRVMATLGGVRSVAVTEQFVAESIDHWREHAFGIWVARHPETGDFIGRGGLRRVVVLGLPEVEVAYALMPECWNRGYATELARESVRVGFQDLQRSDLVSFTYVDNRPSRRVMEKAGFVFEREFEREGLAYVLYRLQRPLGVCNPAAA